MKHNLAWLNLKQHLTWLNFVKSVCAIVAVGLLGCIIVKLVRPAALPALADIKIEVLLVALAVTVLIPSISQFEALGVKVGIREEVDKLSAWTNASPYYTLGSEYEEIEEDYLLAERYYLKSLEQCPTFWPSLFGLASIYDELAGVAEGSDQLETVRNNYDKAILYYKKVIDLDPDNVYAHNNLASDYLSAPKPIYDPEKALEYANGALEYYPSLASAAYYKGEALNYLGKHDEAREILQEIVDKGLLKDDEPYWAMYELAIANSRAGEGLVTEGFLEAMLVRAKKDGAGRKLLRYLKNDLGRFSEKDQPLLKKFWEGHENDPDLETE